MTWRDVMVMRLADRERERRAWEHTGSLMETMVALVPRRPGTTLPNRYDFIPAHLLSQREYDLRGLEPAEKPGELRALFARKAEMAKRRSTPKNTDED